MEYWFNDPFSPFQIVSWLLLFISLVPVINALRLLRVVGKPEGNFEQTTVLVVSGLYKFIRHPMYASLLYLSWGIFFKLPELMPFCLVLGATAFIVATAKAEKNEDIAKFGEAYTEYMKKTKRFIPFVF
jgi:protein-S-isoprenylcysteine O-methyltransferase Ste14